MKTKKKELQLNIDEEEQKMKTTDERLRYSELDLLDHAARLKEAIEKGKKIEFLGSNNKWSVLNSPSFDDNLNRYRVAELPVFVAPDYFTADYVARTESDRWQYFVANEKPRIVGSFWYLTSITGFSGYLDKVAFPELVRMLDEFDGIEWRSSLHKVVNVTMPAGAEPDT